MRCASPHDASFVLADEFPAIVGWAFVVRGEQDEIRVIRVVCGMGDRTGWWAPRGGRVCARGRRDVEEERVLLVDEKLEDPLAELVFARGKLVTGVGDEPGTKDDGEI